MVAHPYSKYERLPVWNVISGELDALVENGDLNETTARKYIVGSLCKALDNAGFLVPTGPVINRKAKGGAPR